jgi:hydrogenase maturation factor
MKKINNGKRKVSVAKPTTVDGEAIVKKHIDLKSPQKKIKKKSEDGLGKYIVVHRGTEVIALTDDIEEARGLLSGNNEMSSTPIRATRLTEYGKACFELGYRHSGG